MTIYTVSIGKNEYQVEVDKDQCKIDGETVQTALIALGERGLYLLRHGVWKRELHVQPQGNSQYAVDVNGRHAVARVEKGRAGRRNERSIGAGEVTAPMPGLVVNVNAAVGDEVEAGQALVVLESMKMQMILRTPCAGKVVQLNVQPKDQLVKGDLLVKIEPAGD